MANSLRANFQMTSSTISDRDHNSKSTTPLSTRQSHIVTKGTHEWLIEDFMKREETTGVSLSTRFTTPCIDAKGVNHETVWRLKAYPKGCDNDHREYISIFINQVSGPVVWVKYNISLLGCHSYDRSTYVHNTRKGAVQFLADRRSSSRGWKKFISLEAVTAPSSSLLHEGGLLIRCTVELESRDDRGVNIPGSACSSLNESANSLVSPSNVMAANVGTPDTLDINERFDHASCSKNYGSANSNGVKLENKMNLLPTLNHFTLDTASQQFIDSMKYTDLILSIEPSGIANPIEIPCHKFMLAKKSDVFDAMFTHDFQETTSNRVIINDLEPEAVMEMVRFMYKGRVQNLERVNQALLVAADKYNIEDLKVVCEISLSDSMDIDNVTDILLLGYTRFSMNLKNKAISFITRNIQAVTISPGWKDICQNAELMTEIVRSMGPI